MYRIHSISLLCPLLIRIFVMCSISSVVMVVEAFALTNRSEISFFLTGQRSLSYGKVCIARSLDLDWANSKIAASEKYLYSILRKQNLSKLRKCSAKNLEIGYASQKAAYKLSCP